MTSVKAAAAILGLLSNACAAAEHPVDSAADAHVDLACASCHQGGLADRGLAAVPPGACTASDCHDQGLPGEVMLETVRFTHAQHDSISEPVAGCAGCHAHDGGARPITAGPQTCGLCHADQLSGSRGEECRTCHASLHHTGLTSQGLSVPHEGLPWIEGGCLRCHYAVSRPVHDVSVGRCAACHEDEDAAVSSGIGEDLHPTHDGNACSACHEEDNHRIEAMSSAVSLNCADCHEEEHEVDVDHAWVDARTCNGCHETVHRSQQRLLLGILPDAEAAAPSDHFMDGVTCRSCHVPSGALRQTGSAAGCVQCHRPEYARVLGWWQQGLSDRIAVVDRYLRSAERDLSRRTGDTPASLARARTALDLAAEGGGVHNLALAHRILEEAVSAAVEGLRSAGATPPSAPRLGRPPRQGICSYCHYTFPPPAFSETMDDAFHRAVVRGGS